MRMVNPAESRRIAPLQLILIAIAVIVPVLLFGAIWLFESEFEENRALRDATSASYESRYELQHLLKLHVDMETAERGFVVSENPAFLEPYNRSDEDIEASLARLRPTFEADHIPDGTMDQLVAESRAKRQFAAETVGLVRARRADEARRLISSGRGKAIMDRIRAITDRIDRLEQRQLAARAEVAEGHRQRLRWTTLLVQAGLLLSLLAGALIGLRLNAARDRALRHVADSNARQSAIFDSATDGMMLLDAHGHIRSLNPAAAEMFGYDPEEMRGQPVAMLYRDPPSPERSEAFLRAIDARRGGATQAQEFVGKRKDGLVFPTEVAVSVVSHQAARTYLAVVRDVTDRKQVEQMKSEFVSVVSHELRTPLTSIAGSLGLLAGGAAGKIPDRAKKLVDIAQSNSARLVRLINDILDIEKIEAGKMAFDIRPLPLAPLIAQGVQANAAFASGLGVAIRVDRIAAEVAVRADEDRLMQVLTNLLSNAAKFSPQGSTVRVKVTPGTATHRISVADSGPGIPEAFRDRIFQKFAQADASDTRAKGGTGLGLSIVAELVERMDGKVSFESAEGEGSTFFVDLPAAGAA